jgi:hypothetical protein
MSEKPVLRRAESVPWILVVAVFVALSVLIAASISSFVSVADAHARVSLFARSSAAYYGLSFAGQLANNGTLTFTIFFTVDDPTSRSVSFYTVGYKIWIEDAPAEAGLKGLIRNPADVQVSNDTEVHDFFLVFDGSVQTQPYPVPAHGNVTFPFMLNLTRASDSDRFAAVQNITAFAVNVLGGTSRIVWNVWAVVYLDIGGIPPASSFSEADYFASISRVQFTVGVDLGGG